MGHRLEILMLRIVDSSTQNSRSTPSLVSKRRGVGGRTQGMFFRYEYHFIEYETEKKEGGETT